LTIAQETIEALEGRIEVESVPGEGSVFTVRLPLPDKEELSGKSLSGKN
jgi:signal transduction histidine kinase